MVELRIVFAYGLKYRIGDDFVKVDTHVSAGSQLPALLRKSTTISLGHVHKPNTSLLSDAFLNKLNF